MANTQSLQVGSIVHASDGTSLRVVAKFATSGGDVCRFSDLHGNLVTTPPEFTSSNFSDEVKDWTKQSSASLAGLKLADADSDEEEEKQQSPSMSIGDVQSIADFAGGSGGEAVGGAAEAAGAAGSAVEALAPLALLASEKEAAKQWEVPRCVGCAKTLDVKDCVGCKQKYCPDCLINHHANSPSHNRIASIRDVVASWLDPNGEID